MDIATDLKIKTIMEKEGELFSEWKERLNTGYSFISDGIADPETYFNGRHPRILYLLKEANADKKDDFDLRKVICEDNERWQTWDNIARWTYGIYHFEEVHNNKPQFTWEDIEKNTIKNKEILKTICAVNPKKWCGGSTANEKEVKRATFESPDLIKKQINLYEPQIIVLCGSSTAYNYSNMPGIQLKWDKTKRGIEYCIDEFQRILISYLHPEARVRNNLLFYGLIDAVKEINENYPFLKPGA